MSGTETRVAGEARRRFADTPGGALILLAPALALLAIAVVADRLPTELGVGAVAILAAAGIGPLSPIVGSWSMGQTIAPPVSSG